MGLIGGPHMLRRCIYGVTCYVTTILIWKYLVIDTSSILLHNSADYLCGLSMNKFINLHEWMFIIADYWCGINDYDAANWESLRRVWNEDHVNITHDYVRHSVGYVLEVVSFHQIFCYLIVLRMCTYGPTHFVFLFPNSHTCTYVNCLLHQGIIW